MRSPVKGEINRPSTSTSTEPSPSRVGTTLIDKGSTVVAGSVNQPCNRLLGLGHSLAIKPMPKRDPPRSINLRASFEMVSMRRQFHGHRPVQTPCFERAAAQPFRGPPTGYISKPNQIWVHQVVDLISRSLDATKPKFG
jgi:hypothetical protein